METAYREPNGRPSRSSAPPDAVALEARARHLGLTLVKAKDQRAETFIGYLNILGPIDGLSDRQYEAATQYLALRSDYLQSKKAPDALLDNDRVGVPSDFVSPQYEDWCEDVDEAYMKCRKAIQDAQNETRENLWAAIDLCIIQSHHLHHMIGATRVACNCLQRFFKC